MQGFCFIYDNYLRLEIEQSGGTLQGAYGANDNSIEHNMKKGDADGKESLLEELSDKFMKEDQFSSFSDSLISFPEEK